MSWQSEISSATAELARVEDRLRDAVRGRASEVADRMGTSRPALYAWLSGQRGVSRNWLARLAEAVDSLPPKID